MRLKTNKDNADVFIRLVIKKSPRAVKEVLQSEEWKAYTSTNIYCPLLVYVLMQG